jgi:hypothetical protein
LNEVGIHSGIFLRARSEQVCLAAETLPPSTKNHAALHHWGLFDPSGVFQLPENNPVILHQWSID